MLSATFCRADGYLLYGYRLPSVRVLATFCTGIGYLLYGRKERFRH